MVAKSDSHAGNRHRARSTPMVAPHAMAVRVPVSLADILAHAGQIKGLLLVVMIGIFGLGIGAAVLQPAYYVASARLFVAIPPPLEGQSAPAGNLPHSVAGEMALLSSGYVVEEVLPRFGLEVLYPGLVAKAEQLAGRPSGEEMPATEGIEEGPLAAPPPTRSDALRTLGARALRRDFSVSSASASPVITVQYQHTDRQLAIDVLNALMGAYFRYRAEVFAPGDQAAQNVDLAKTLEGDLLDTERAIRQLLDGADLRNFSADRTAVQALERHIRAEHLANRSRAQFVASQIEVYRREQASMPAQIDLFTEDRRLELLNELRLEREQLLSRYTKDAQPVEVINREIERLDAYEGDANDLPGRVRRGPNPVYQDIEANLTRLVSEARALADQDAELDRQLADIEARLALFVTLEPDWRALQRQREMIEARLKRLTAAESAGALRARQAWREADTVQVLEVAQAPIRPSNDRWLILIGAAIVSLLAGLLLVGWRVIRSPGLMTRGTVERALGLPVLATVRKRRK